jgi:hypothetical protein
VKQKKEIIMIIKQGIFGLVCLALIGSSLQAAEENPVFKTLKYGLFCHYGWGGTAYALTRNPDLSVPRSVDEVADALDVQKFADDVASFKVEYVVFTAWHASMNPMFPSKVMEKWRGPGHDAKKDVIGELAKALKAKGILLYLYVHPSDGQDMLPEDQDRLGWNESEGAWATDKYKRWNDFMNQMFDEMGARYGNEIKGYWVDGGWERIDQERLKKTVWKYNPQAEFVSGMDCADPVAAWKIYAPVVYRDVNTWPGWECQVGILEGGCWWSTGGTARLSPEEMLKYTVLEAGVNTQGGGACWAAGPYTGGTWEPNVKQYLTDLGALLEPIAQSVKSTYASSAFPTPQGTKIASLPYGIVATRSADGRNEYIHVLRPPGSGIFATDQDRILHLPAPKDGQRFSSAVMLRTGRTAVLKQDEKELSIAVPWEDACWDPVDTIIKLTSQPGYGNLAAGKSVSASSAHKDWPAANLVDGDKNSGWSTDGSENPAWVVVDLGKSMPIQRIHLYPRISNGIVGYNFPVDFSIQVSEDNASWKTVVSKSNYTCTKQKENPDGAISKMSVDATSGDMQAFPLSAPIDARYVRIEATRLKDENYMQLMEIEVYGCDPDIAQAAQSQ